MFCVRAEARTYPTSLLLSDSSMNGKISGEINILIAN